MSNEAILDAARRAEGSDILREVVFSEDAVDNPERLGVVQLGMRYRADELIVKMGQIIAAQENIMAEQRSQIEAMDLALNSREDRADELIVKMGQIIAAQESILAEQRSQIEAMDLALKSREEEAAALSRGIELKDEVIALQRQGLEEFMAMSKRITSVFETIAEPSEVI